MRGWYLCTIETTIFREEGGEGRMERKTGYVEGNSEIT